MIEPYKDQAYGSTTAHYAIQSFTDLSNDKYGITVSPIEGSLVCYGEPTSTPILMNYENGFKTDRTYPAKSRLYLYLLNNMWDMNNAVDQQGPINFSWALRSHSGDWKTSGADRFGHSVQQPLMAWRADGKNNGPLPVSASFMSVDAANVACSVVKQAEMNGRGFIKRLNETAGQETVATVTLPLLPEIESARATSLVENDRPEQYPVAGNSFKLTMPKFSIKTVRVTFADTMPAVGAIQAVPVADKWVNLTWKADGASCSHVNIYRDTDPKCALTQLNFIGQSADGCYADIPRLHLGGWLRSCLAPATTYYYRLVPVDRYNNPGTPSATVAVTTLASAQANLPPVAVEALSAIPVSPLSPKFNFVNLLFRTACEPDVVGYEIHRGTKPDFAAGAGSLVGTVNSEDKVPSSGGSAERGRIFKVKEYDHATYADMTVKAATTYYYKVRAVDAAGQKGAFSEEVSISTK